MQWGDRDKRIFEAYWAALPNQWDPGQWETVFQRWTMRKEYLQLKTNISLKHTHMHVYTCIYTHTHTAGVGGSVNGLLKLFQRSECLQELHRAGSSYFLEESLFRAFQWETIAAPLSTSLEQRGERSCHRISIGKTVPRHGMQPVRMLQPSQGLWFSGLGPISCRLLTSDDQQST